MVYIHTCFVELEHQRWPRLLVNERRREVTSGARWLFALPEDQRERAITIIITFGSPWGPHRPSDYAIRTLI
jgi:hypothetical protein